MNKLDSFDDILFKLENDYSLKGMSNNEMYRVTKLTKAALNDGHFILLGYDPIFYDGQYMENTKPIDAILIINKKIVPLDKINTWAGLLRSVNEAIKPYKTINKEFDKKNSFEKSISSFISEFNLTMNKNFSEKLFDDDSYINSSVYLNNQNHKLEVFDYGKNKYICAVYPTEVIVVLNALLSMVDNCYLYMRYCVRKEVDMPISKKTIEEIIKIDVDEKLQSIYPICLFPKTELLKPEPTKIIDSKYISNQLTNITELLQVILNEMKNIKMERGELDE